VLALHPTRFHGGRPADLREATLGHRLRHVIKVLPAALEVLAPDLHVPSDGRILDYGGAEKPYRRFFPATVEYVEADFPGIPDADLEIRPDGSLPAPDESFDAILSTQVLEHVADPRLYVSEGFRCLRPGGRILLSTHGIMAYHPDPVDYWRWTCAGLKLELSKVGFEIERFDGIIGMVGAGLQLILDAVYWRLPRRIRPLAASVIQTLISIADRLEGRQSRELNALVFALVARKP
jgi:SAM-dependent methyltransferase